MKICTFEISRYTLPLIKPLAMMGSLLNERRGLLIRFQNEENHSGWGEIAPFPGLHPENLSAAEAQILHLQKILYGQSLPPGLPQLNGAFEEWLGKYKLFPSVRYGVEMAALNLLADAGKRPLCALLSPNYRDTVSLNGLLSGSPEEIHARLQLLIDEGYKAVKLKVGHQSVEEDIVLVQQVRKALPATASLRLDANRAWSLEQALAFGEAVSDCVIEYIEEPLTDNSGLERFHTETGLSLALDETLAKTETHSLRIPNGVAAFILKPALLGGFEHTTQFARLARQHHLKAVISSAFQSGVGLAADANLAAGLNDEDVPAGLGTYQWLKEDVLVERFQAQNGRVNVVEAWRKSKNLRMDLLIAV
jgi:o-succinylbenzoate synthase